MITEFGHYALVTALFAALIQSTVPLVGAARGDGAWISAAKPAAIVQFVLVAIAFAALTQAYVTSDFSVNNVYENSHSMKPMIYKVTGVWGNHEGSLLLWVLILALFGCCLALFSRRLPPSLMARVLAVQGMIGVGFLAFILFTSNPFLRLPHAPLDGTGLNPLLQDPGLALHPPFLYLGYVGFSVAFSFAIAALLEGRVDAAWARWVRPWTMAAWAFLTIGVGLGSWWAYYELGWGGWWFWDPVENASFIPWLSGTALLHSVIVVEKRDTMKAWTVFLAIVTFSLSLLGTFLVRSGVLTSVHAFATDPARGVFILILLILVAGGSLALFASRGPALKSTGLFQPISREGGLLLNNLLMSAAAAVVLLGTLYPLFLDAIGGAKVSVGAPFFNSVFFPIMTPMAAAMAVGPLLAWKRGDLFPALKKLWAAFVMTAAAVIATWSFHSDGPPIGLLGMGLAAWLFTGTLVEFAERAKLARVPLLESFKRMAHFSGASWGMTLAHLGLAVAIAGMAGAGSWKVESIQVMKPGDSVDVAGYQYTFNGARQRQGPNYSSTVGSFTVREDGREIVTLQSEKRVYPVRNMPTTEAAIHTMFLGDLYAVIGDPDKDVEGGFITRLYYNPFVVWLWAGGLIMVLGAALSVADRRYRIGAPAHRRQAATAKV